MCGRDERKTDGGRREDRVFHEPHSSRTSDARLIVDDWTVPLRNTSDVTLKQPRVTPEVVGGLGDVDAPSTPSPVVVVGREVVVETTLFG